MSSSVRPHRWQPTRLPRPWDSPGKNTGVGCHFLLQCMEVKSESEFAQSCLTLTDPMDCSLPVSSVHGTSQARVLGWVASTFSAIMHILICLPVFHRSCRRYSFFFILFLVLRLDNISCFILKFSDSIFRLFKSAVEPF